jgi:GMP synthase-like glutamine amidotransferase
MNIHYLQHVSYEGPGSIASWAHARRYWLSRTRLHEGDGLPALSSFDCLAIMGGPMGVYETGRFPWLTEEKKLIESAIHCGKKVLGVCLGAQLVADVLGARVYANRYREIGWFPVETGSEADLGGHTALPERFEAFHWHGDTFDIPAGAIHAARSNACENQAFTYDSNVLALQFHCESTLQSAQALIENCREEIDPDKPYVQSPAMLLSDHARFQKTNAIMSKLLESFFEKRQ